MNLSAPVGFCKPGGGVFISWRSGCPSASKLLPRNEIRSKLTAFSQNLYFEANFATLKVRSEVTLEAGIARYSCARFAKWGISLYARYLCSRDDRVSCIQ